MRSSLCIARRFLEMRGRTVADRNISAKNLHNPMTLLLKEKPLAELSCRIYSPKAHLLIPQVAFTYLHL
jgi:hypothetical protein